MPLDFAPIYADVNRLKELFKLGTRVIRFRSDEKRVVRRRPFFVRIRREAESRNPRRRPAARGERLTQI